MSFSTISSRAPSCQVCGGPTNGIYHYSVICCRACASFFHRSAKENREYSCRNDQNCVINNDDGLRNSCRACRLKKCLAVGMKIEQSKSQENSNEAQQLPLIRHSPVNSISPQQHSTQYQVHSWPEISYDDGTLETKIPVTMQFDQALRQFAHGHRALSVIEGISTDLTGESARAHQQLKLLNYDDFQRAEKGTILLVFAMIREYFPPLNELPGENKLKLLKYFSKQFTLMNLAEMTVKLFPDSNSPYAVIIPGGIIDRNHMEVLYGQTIEDAEKREEYVKAFCHRHFDFLRSRYDHLKITSLEFSALVALLFWNTVEYTASEFIAPEIYNSKRDELYVELSIIIEANRQKQFVLAGEEAAQPLAVRFGNLLDLLHKLAIFTLEIKEVSAMAKIFMDMPDFWDDIKLPS